jgi:hypothetical protein
MKNLFVYYALSAVVIIKLCIRLGGKVTEEDLKMLKIVRVTKKARSH